MGASHGDREFSEFSEISGLKFWGSPSNFLNFRGDLNLRGDLKFKGGPMIFP